LVEAAKSKLQASEPSRLQGPQQQQQQGAKPHSGLGVRDVAASLAGHRTDAAALALLAACTAAAAAGVGLQGGQTWLRTIWVSILLGPLG
jgi:hypothetical protein